MHQTYKKGKAFLIVSSPQQPPAGYIEATPADIPAPEDTYEYTYQWLRSDGIIRPTGRYACLQATYAPARFSRERSVGRPRVTTRKPRDMGRRALQSKLYRLRDKEYKIKQCRSKYPDATKRIQAIQRKIRNVEHRLRVWKYTGMDQYYQRKST